MILGSGVQGRIYLEAPENERRKGGERRDKERKEEKEREKKREFNIQYVQLNLQLIHFSSLWLRGKFINR